MPGIVEYCARCGEDRGAGDHLACDAALVLEPPRYCTQCRRRMVVQVVPTGWTARCSEHGETSGGDTIDPLV
ncbi:MAG: hypothetical protein GC157_12555 [Frankiales bacterium]|nr:hypothetical protein [Frankiales bacterium]